MVAAMSAVDRVEKAWGALVDWWIGRKAVKTVDACAMYWGRVVKVDRNKVDVQLDTDQIASPSNVPLYLGFPGSSVTLSGGERVLVGFRNGDPAQPYAIAFEFSSPFSQITIGSTRPARAARQGDPVNLGECYVTVGAGGAVTGVFIDGTQLPVGADTAPDRGQVSDGSPNVLIGE
jgi:hypothetical protein